MSSDPVLPTLRTNHSVSPLRSSTFKLPSKRSWGYDASNSSDPPLFSSDDYPGLEDNEEYPRKKRRYRGTWWGEELPGRDDATAKKDRVKKPFTRCVDSGVWMNSDETESESEERHSLVRSTSEEASDNETEHPQTAKLTETGVHGDLQTALNENMVSDSIERPSRLSQLGMIEREPISYVKDIVERCVEDSNEVVCLSIQSTQGWQLREPLATIPNSVLRPLRYLTKKPKVDDLPSSQEIYSALVPQIHLDLSLNGLRAVPGEIFNLENLKVLSLRGNKLRELPPGIGRLSNLEELNIGANELRWLPWEIKDLLASMKLRNINLHPNPYLNPDPSFSLSADLRNEWVYRGGAFIDSLECRPKPIHLCSSHTAFFESDGSRHSKSAPGPSATAGRTDYLPTVPRDYIFLPPDKESSSAVPSLLECAVRSCSRAANLSQLESYLPLDAPRHLGQLIHDIDKVEEAGGRSSKALTMFSHILSSICFVYTRIKDCITATIYGTLNRIKSATTTSSSTTNVATNFSTAPPSGSYSPVVYSPLSSSPPPSPHSSHSSTPIPSPSPPPPTPPPPPPPPPPMSTATERLSFRATLRTVLLSEPNPHTRRALKNAIITQFRNPLPSVVRDAGWWDFVAGLEGCDGDDDDDDDDEQQQQQRLQQQREMARCLHEEDRRAAEQVEELRRHAEIRQGERRRAEERSARERAEAGSDSE
ncbi:MAG: hypothetical protein M1827_007297 [Pycnora praestabilis]|nr:MAG: hypothetical protein M1827_007297 [Pycnora praestabilis]